MFQDKAPKTRGVAPVQPAKIEKKEKRYCPGVQNTREQLQMDRVIDCMIARTPSPTDPNGSYTGVPCEYGELPIQDADDL